LPGVGPRVYTPGMKRRRPVLLAIAAAAAGSLLWSLPSRDADPPAAVAPDRVTLPPLRGYTAAALIVEARWINCIRELPEDGQEAFREAAIADVLAELSAEPPGYAEAALDAARRAHGGR